MPHNPSRASGWTLPSLGVVIVHALLLQVVTFSLRPSLSYAALEAGLGTEWLGMLSAAFALPGLALAIPAGQFTDRVGERVIAVAGGVLMTGGAALALIAHHSIGTLIAATTMFGCGHLLSVIADQALLANRTKPARRDSVFGAYAFTISLGQGVGGALLAIGAGDSATPDLPLQFALSTALAGLGLFCAIAMRRSRVHGAFDGAVGRVSPLRMLRRPHVLRAVVASSVVVTAVEISLVYFPSLGYERGFPASVVSAMLVGRSIAAMASRLGLGLWIRLIGRRRLMVGSVALSAAAFAMLALPLDAVATVVLCAVFGLFNGVSQPLTLSWLSEISLPGQRGTLMSIRIASVRISQTTIPAGVGLLGSLVGVGGVFVAVAALVGAASWMSAAIDDTPRADPEPPDAATEAA